MSVDEDLSGDASEEVLGKVEGTEWQLNVTCFLQTREFVSVSCKKVMLRNSPSW